MTCISKILRSLTGILFLLPVPTLAHSPELPNPPPANKLMYMYQFYYLPYNLEFRAGKDTDEFYSYWVNSQGALERMLTPDELKEIDKEWTSKKEAWKKRSLLLTTPVSTNQSVRISQHLVSHSISLSRSPFEDLPIADRIKIAHVLESRPPQIQAVFKQMRFLKSLLRPEDEFKFNFFLVSASWCDSCKEYRALLETYAKMFPHLTLAIHSVVIDDPKEEVFKSALLKMLFPNPKQYAHHESIPRFLALEWVHGQSKVYEEGDALKVLYERFFKEHRGFMRFASEVKESNPVENTPRSPGNYSAVESRLKY